MIATLDRASAASEVYKGQALPAVQVVFWHDLVAVPANVIIPIIVRKRRESTSGMKNKNKT